MPGSKFFCKIAMLSRFVALFVSLNLESITLADDRMPLVVQHLADGGWRGYGTTDAEQQTQTQPDSGEKR